MLSSMWWWRVMNIWCHKLEWLSNLQVLIFHSVYQVLMRIHFPWELSDYRTFIMCMCDVNSSFLMCDHGARQCVCVCRISYNEVLLRSQGWDPRHEQNPGQRWFHNHEEGHLCNTGQTKCCTILTSQEATLKNNQMNPLTILLCFQCISLWYS